MKHCIAVVSFFLILIGCQKKDITPPQQSANTTDNLTQVPENVKLILIKSGFDTSNVQLWKDKYLVDDIMLTGKHIKEFEEQLKTGKDQRHAHTNNLLSGNNTNVTIRLNDINSNRWANTIRQAITEWNQVPNCRVNLILTDAATADITIFEEDLGELAYGWAYYPLSNGQPGNEIHLTNRFQLRSSVGGPFVTLTNRMDLWTAIHEIGHTLGFRHTDWENFESANPVGANYFPGINTYDPNSVMNSGSSTWLWEYFNLTSNDVLAIQTLYPVITGTTFENYILGQELIWANSQRTHTAGTYYPSGHYKWELYNPWNELVADFDETGPVLEWDVLLLQDDDYYLRCTVTNLEAPGVVFTKHIRTRP